jgi:hypothetical protein
VCVELEAPPGRLFHGEILRNVVEYVPTGLMDADGAPEIGAVLHPLVVVLTPACDLVSDYEERDELASGADAAGNALNSKLLPHIQCCDLFLDSEFRGPFGFNSRSWSLVKENRDVRFHRVPAEDIDGLNHPDLFLDFKRIISVPTEYLYRKLNDNSAERCGEIPPPWMSQLLQRCYGFQGRVCVPDPSDLRLSAQI